MKTTAQEHSLASTCPPGISDRRPSQIDDGITVAEGLFPITRMFGIPTNAFTDVSHTCLRTRWISAQDDDVVTVNQLPRERFSDKPCSSRDDHFHSQFPYRPEKRVPPRSSAIRLIDPVRTGGASLERRIYDLQNNGSSDLYTIKSSTGVVYATLVRLLALRR